MPEKESFFLKLDGISGDSKDPDHAGWIDVESYSIGTSRVVLSSDGAGPGKADFDVFFFVSPLGRHSPLLAHAAHTGWYIKSGVLEIVRGAGCTRTVSLRIRFTDPMISTYQVTDGYPRDQFGLTFGEIRYEAGTPPPAAQTVPPLPRQLVRPAATRRALKK
jgi:type VI protein secretion system component Hcp